jgi:protein-tyrosine-phosphatase
MLIVIVAQITDNGHAVILYLKKTGRSQMAEGFFRRYAAKNYEPLSAGTSPASIVNPLAIEVMRGWHRY